jgi:hypothetical protein
MDFILIAVTLISLMVAVVMSVIAGRLLREDRRRSDARVEALWAEAEAADAGPVARVERTIQRPIPQIREPEIRERVPVAFSQTPVQVSDAMFGTVQRTPESSRKPLALAAVSAVFALIAAVIFFTSGPAEKPAAAAVRAATSTSDPSLDLLSLNHGRTDKEWRITGTVRNPESSVEMGRVTALVFLFDDAGTFVGSGRAPLELAKLGAGETSPFSVSVAPTGPVARYRIGFRGEDGRVIRHFDRRPAAPLQARQ